MRALLQPLGRRAVSAPIETIVFFFIVGTLAYFNVLSAIKHSAFFAPTFPSTLRPAHALFREGEWVGVDENWYSSRPSDGKVELQQIIFTLPPSQDEVSICVIFVGSRILMLSGHTTFHPRVLCPRQAVRFLVPPHSREVHTPVLHHGVALPGLVTLGNPDPLLCTWVRSRVRRRPKDTCKIRCGHVWRQIPRRRSSGGDYRRDEERQVDGIRRPGARHAFLGVG